MGVVDILPSCLSSKYFFWDPDHAHLSLGRISALKEIEWVAEASQDCPSLHYYYMGFYIHVSSPLSASSAFLEMRLDSLCPTFFTYETVYTASYLRSPHDEKVYQSQDQAVSANMCFLISWTDLL